MKWLTFNNTSGKIGQQNTPKSQTSKTATTSIEPLTQVKVQILVKKTLVNVEMLIQLLYFSKSEMAQVF